jgi:hypothetical protein
MVFSTVSRNDHCRGAVKSQVILNGLAMEVNAKFNQTLALSKLLQLLRKPVRDFGRFRDKSGDRGLRMEARYKW